MTKVKNGVSLIEIIMGEHGNSTNFNWETLNIVLKTVQKLLKRWSQYSLYIIDSLRLFEIHVEMLLISY